MCRHERYRVEYAHVFDTFDQVACVAWHCVKCGVIMEPRTIGQATRWKIVGFDPVARIDDVWRTIPQRRGVIGELVKGESS